MQHRRSEVLEHAHLRTYFSRHGLCQGDAASFHHDIDIRVGTAQEAVADVAADDEGAHAQLTGHVRNQLEHGSVQVSFRYRWHSISSQSGAFSTKENPSSFRSNIKVFRPLVITM